MCIVHFVDIQIMHKLNIIMPEKTSFIKAKALNADIDEKKAEYIETDITKYAVDYDHVHIAIKEFSESIETSDDHSGFKLTEIVDKLDITAEDISNWQIGNEQNVKKRLKSLVQYAEKDGTASPDIKVKIRVITKMILESKTQKEYKDIILLLASHGNVKILYILSFPLYCSILCILLI